MAKSIQPAKIPLTDDDSAAASIEVKIIPKPSEEAEPVLTAPELPDTANTETTAVVPPEHEEPLDPETEKAVDDITAQEADELLAAEDEKVTQAFDNKKPKKGKLRRAWSAWWHSPVKRRLTLAACFIGLLTALTVPASRYLVLNTVGVRSSASIIILDDSTQQPLKNVQVKLGSLTTVTDKEGKASFSHVRLGKAKLSLEKRAFAARERLVTIGWGSNPLEPLTLEPVGSQYQFKITDYLSAKPVAKVEAVSGLSSALSNEEGVLKLTLDTTSEETSVEVQITAEGYRDEKVTLDLANREVVNLELVPARSHVFISKRSGRYDVYKIDADGQNEEKVLSGSGVERDDLILIQHPTKNYAALVSTRENVRNNDGFLLSTLTLIDLEAKQPTKVAQSERIQIVDWVGDRLIYVQIRSGASAEDPSRHRLMSYDLASGQSKELAAANYFNDVLAVGSTIFYAPSAAYAPGNVAFYKINADGGGKQTALNEEVWNVYRTEYDKLVLSVGQDWYNYQISTGKATLLSAEPANLQSHVYVDSPDHKQSLWVDQRDGEGVLLAYDVTAKSDKIIHQRSGLRTPVHWLGDRAIVFRVSTSQETADYVMSLDGGEPKKLKNVTDTTGVDRWYYY